MGKEHVRGDKLHHKLSMRMHLFVQLDCKPERQLACRTSQSQARKIQLNQRKIVPVAWMEAAQFCAYTQQEPDMNVHPSLMR